MSFGAKSSHDVDLLGSLSSQLAQRARGRGRGTTRKAAGVRLSVADLRARGVDDTFLAPAASVDAGVSPISVVDSDASVAFIRGAKAEEARADVGKEAKGAAERQKEWTLAEMQEEYGIGYSLLARMGYAGGGRVPLAPIKRAPRVGLQDNEDLAIDRRVPVPKAKKRRKKIQAAREYKRHAVSQGASVGIGRESENTTIDTPSLASIPLETLDEDDSIDDMSEDIEDSEEAKLAKTIVATVRGADRQLKLSDLIEQPSIRRALASKWDFVSDSSLFLKDFVRRHVPQCRLQRSAGADWYKLSSHSSTASWESATRPEHVIVLRSAKETGSEVSSNSVSQSSSEDMHPDGTKESIGLIPCQEYRCHSCGKPHSSCASLREHLVGKLSVRTTRDPTDLTAQFDPEHCDRAILNAAAETRGGNKIGWRCPVCAWCTTEAECSFEDLISHALNAPEVRAKHQRFLMLITELLIREPPPRFPLSGSPQWCSSDLVRLFEVTRMDHMQTQTSRASAYIQLEEEMLGPEEDIFGSLFNLTEQEEVEVNAEARLGNLSLPRFGPEPLTFV